jgi:hypothetical protein
MKNRLTITTLVAVALATSFTASADSQGAFVSAGAGHSNATPGNSRAYDVMGGYRWEVDRPFYLGVEGGYVDLSRIKRTFDSSDAFTDITGPHTLTSHSRTRATNKGLLLGVNGKWELPGNYFIVAHAGVARYRDELRYRDTGTLDGVPTEGFGGKYRFYSTNYYAGAGFGYNFSPQVGLSFMYDRYAPRYEGFQQKTTVNFDTWSAAVEFRF